jgi:hypothetical protein
MHRIKILKLLIAVLNDATRVDTDSFDEGTWYVFDVDYRGQCEEKQTSSLPLLWRSYQMQYLRFDALRNIMNTVHFIRDPRPTIPFDLLPAH